MGNHVNPSESIQEDLQHTTLDVISQFTAEDWELMADALETQGQGGRLREALVDRARQMAKSIRDQQLKS